MIWIIFIWSTSAILALGAVLLAFRRAWRWRAERGMRYVLGILVGGAVYDVFSCIIALAAIPRSSLIHTVPIGTLLLTIGHLAMVIPSCMFALYLIGIMNGHPPTWREHDAPSSSKTAE